jgi:hypothetical protein
VYWVVWGVLRGVGCMYVLLGEMASLTYQTHTCRVHIRITFVPYLTKRASTVDPYCVTTDRSWTGETTEDE